MDQRWRVLSLLLLAAITSSTAVAQSNVRYYRYALSLRSQETTYRVEVPDDAHGQHFEVETDAEGRIARVASLRNGQKEDETLYHFAADSKLADEFETYRHGAKTGRTRIQRNTDGDRARTDFFTVDGTRTAYTLYSYRPDAVEATSYTAAGKPTQVWIYSYSAQGILTAGTVYANPERRGFRVDIDYDEATGLKKARRQFVDGSLENSGKFTYDAEGEEIRQDVYNAAGQWMAAGEYRDGLLTRRLYDIGKELLYSYDERRLLKETKLLMGGVLVCRLTYDRQPDGTAKRTRALGPDGRLWAEYPDQEVWEVDSSGAPISGKPVLLHKTSRWF